MAFQSFVSNLKKYKPLFFVSSSGNTSDLLFLFFFALQTLVVVVEVVQGLVVQN